MSAYRSERRNFTKSKMALAWAESQRSEILWVDGYQILTRADFNASFVFPLLQLVEGKYEQVVTLRHFCESHHGTPDKYLLMMQALVFQVFQQNPSIAERKKASLMRDKTSKIHALWDLLSELLEDVQAQCVFLVIGGIDNLFRDTPDARDTRKDMVDRFHDLMDTKGRFVKVTLTLGLPQPKSAAVEGLSSLAVYRHQAAPTRTLSFDAMQNILPTMSLQLIEIQEKRCQNVGFAQLPMLYTPGSIIYVQDRKRLQAFVVFELSGMEQTPFGGYRPLRIRAWSVDHNGVYFCKQFHDFQVAPSLLG